MSEKPDLLATLRRQIDLGAEAGAELRLTNSAFEKMIFDLFQQFLEIAKDPSARSQLGVLADTANAIIEAQAVLNRAVAAGDAAHGELAKAMKRMQMSHEQRRFADMLG